MKKILLVIFIIFLLFGIILIYQNITYRDKKLHIVFCDVGQGDAIFVKTPHNSDILIDGGPDGSVLSCISKHMPFWDRTIEIMILTHPDADHLTGLLDVIKRYRVVNFYTSNVQTDTLVYKEFLKIMDTYKVKQKHIWKGDRFVFQDNLILNTLWPANLSGEGDGFDISNATNTFSVANLVSYKDFNVLLTGDLNAEQMEDVDDDLEDVDLLKIPHHGSRFGLTEGILSNLKPNLAVISVGSKNSYGHPTPFILDLLKNSKIKTLRTDIDGEIEIISDGIDFTVKTKN